MAVGTTDDWAYGELGIAAFTFEVGPSSGSCGGFFPSFTCLDGGAGGAFWPRNLPAFLYAARIARTPFELAQGPTPEAATAAVLGDGRVQLRVRFDERANGGQAIAAAEYYLDTPPWSGGTPLVMTAEDGAFDAPVEVAAAVLDALTERHIVFARARDSAGAWGPFRAVFTPDPSCAASLSPPAQSVAASGGAGSVALAITDGCAWTADTLDTWVTVTTSAGVGPGTVSYQVPPNTGTTSRTAVIVIAGQPLAIDQAGVSPADLRVTAVTVSPSIVAPGSKLSITDTVVNQGDASAGASTTRYYLSSDSQKGAGDLLLSGARTVPSLAAGASSTGTVPSVVVPAATPLGGYHVLACADDAGTVIEANESNNCLASAATIQVTRPDLVVTAVTDPPTAAAPGSTFKIWDTVQNQGAIAATSSLTRFYLSRDVQKGAGDLLLGGSRAVPPLAAGASSAGALLNVTIPSTTPLDTYYVLACADDTATVAETDNPTTAARRRPGCR